MFYIRKGNELNNFMNSFDSLFNMGFLATDVEETENAYNLYIDVPGVDKKDIKIKYEDDILTVSVNSNIKDKKNYIKKERIAANAERSYSLENGNPNEIKAKLDSGVLTITVLKMPKVDNKKIISIE